MATTDDYDGTDILFVGLMLLFVLSPVVLVFGITGGVAWHNTRQWLKARTAGFPQPLPTIESADPDADSDDEYLDSEDEREQKAKQKDEEEDRELTTRQKFRKEFGKVWFSRKHIEVEKDRKRKERKEFAKAVAREIERREARQQRRQQAESSNAAGLAEPPSYANVTAGDRKQ